MSEPSLFDVIQKRALEIVDFHLITHHVDLTDDDRDAVELGMSSGIHAAIEEFTTRGFTHPGGFQ